MSLVWIAELGRSKNPRRRSRAKSMPWCRVWRLYGQADCVGEPGLEFDDPQVPDPGDHQ